MSASLPGSSALILGQISSKSYEERSQCLHVVAQSVSNGDGAYAIWLAAREAFVSGTAWQEYNLQSSRVVQAGPRLDSLLLLVVAFPHVQAEAVQDPVFWRMLHMGIQVRDSNRQHRKAALMLLKRALRVLSDAPAACWDLYVQLLEGLEDMPTHLILEIWPRARGLAASTGGIETWGTQEPGSDDDLALTTAKLSGQVPGLWLAALFNRAFTSDVAQSKRNLLLFSLGAEDLMRDERTRAETTDAQEEGEEESELANASSEDTAVHDVPLGDYVGTYVKKAWMHAGPGKRIAMDTVTLAAMPPWYITGSSQLLACLTDPALFTGNSGLFGRALGRFLTNYASMLCAHDKTHAGSSLYMGFLTQLLTGIQLCAQNKGAMKSLLLALTHMPAAPSQAALSPSVMSGLRWAMLSQSHINTRTLSETLMRRTGKIVLKFAPAAALDDSTLASVGQFLSALPTSILYDQSVATAHEGEANKHSFQQELATWAAQADAQKLKASLSSFIQAWLSGFRTASATAPSASALARLLAVFSGLLGHAGVLHCLSPLADSLGKVHSHTYMPSTERIQCLLLLRALMCDCLPQGGNGDVHLSRNVSGPAVVVTWQEYAEPLYADWCAGNRKQDSTYPGVDGRLGATLDYLAAVQDVHGELPYDDVSDAIAALTGAAGVRTARTPSPALLSAVQAVLTQEHVSSELASYCEGSVGSGLMITARAGTAAGLALWSPDTCEASYSTSKQAQGEDLLLNTTFYLAILRDSCRVCPRADPLVSSVGRLVARACDIAEGQLQASGQKQGPLKMEPLAAMQHANAMHILAVLTGILLPYTSQHSLLSVLEPAPAGAKLLSMLDLLREGALQRPKGATEPAVPYELAPGAVVYAPGRVQSVPWLAVRTLAERSRWAAVEALLQHGSRHGWGAAHADSTSFAGLPSQAANALAASICDALDGAGEGDAACLMRLAAWVIPYCLGPGESEADVSQALRAVGFTHVAPLNSVSLESVLSALGQQAWGSKPSKQELLAYTSAVMHPSLFLRPTLHAVGGCLVKHLTKAWMILSDDAHAGICAQVYVARLLSSCTRLVRFAGTGNEVSAHSALHAYTPLLVAALMHREFVLSWDDPALVDSHTHAQMMTWLKARSASASPSYWKAGCEAIQEELVASAGGGDVGMRDVAVDPASVLPSRGAGAITRVQALTWLEWLCRQMCAGNSVALSVAQSILLQLVRLNTLPSWCGEVSAGGPTHAAKLRCWQTICLLSGWWGKQEGSGADTLGHVYDPALDVWYLEAQASSKSAMVMQSAEALLATMSLSADSTKVLKLSKGQGGRKAGPVSSMQANDASSASPWSVGMAGAAAGVLAPATVALLTVIVSFRYLLRDPQTPSVRHYVEVSLACILRRFPSVCVRGVLRQELTQYNPKSQAAFSLMLVSAVVTKHVSHIAATASPSRALASECAALGKLLLSSVFPWLTCPVGLVRLLSQLAVDDAVPLLFPNAESLAASGDPDACGVLAWVLPTLRLVQGCAEVHEMVQRQRKHVQRLENTREVCSLRALLTSPVTEHGELVPVDVYSSIRRTFQALTVAMHVRDPLYTEESDCVPAHVTAAITAGLLPSTAGTDQRLRDLPGLHTGDSSSSGSGSHSWLMPKRLGQPTTDSPSIPAHEGTTEAVYQRKVLSATDVSAQAEQYNAHAQSLVSEAIASMRSLRGEGLAHALDEPGTGGGREGAGSEGNPEGSSAHSASFALRTRHNPLLPCLDESGRPYQPLVLVASLVDKAPNLGGIARTCEIFSAESLVVRDKRITADPAFKDTSVTAGEWMPIHEVPSDTPSLLAYLTARKAQGYTIAALEQASRSVTLGSQPLPEKLVLLLGAEKEGVPSELLAAVDLILEVPQSGLIRSLNVHVSAALVTWQYTRERLTALQRAQGAGR